MPSRSRIPVSCPYSRAVTVTSWPRSFNCSMTGRKTRGCAAAVMSIHTLIVGTVLPNPPYGWVSQHSVADHGPTQRGERGALYGRRGKLRVQGVTLHQRLGALEKRVLFVLEP